MIGPHVHMGPIKIDGAYSRSIERHFFLIRPMKRDSRISAKNLPSHHVVSKHVDDTHLVSLQSSLDSNQDLYLYDLCGNEFPPCYFWKKLLAAGSTGDEMDQDWRSRSCCPSMLSRPHR